ncbi:MAG: glycoside hydrolase family 140 protein [Chloroflexota bacterium]
MTIPRIQVHPDHRFLVTESGEPFFWLADTAWELFHRLNRTEAEHYLEVRRQQGFNVIKAVILASRDGLRTPNTNGHIALLDDDPTRPNENYFSYIDEIIRLAAEKGLYVGLLPTWADNVQSGTWGPAIFNMENTHIYGKFLGQRYRNDTNILWILGGDLLADGYENLWAAMADGITEGLGYKPFLTYHPNGGASSSAVLHESDWLDMNMIQSGHVLLDTPIWEMIRADYERTPTKPVLDGEPNYEGHPVDPFLRKWQFDFGRFTDYDVRKQGYRSVFAGACGYTYGHHAIWQFWAYQHKPVDLPTPTWDEAMFASGAAQMIHLKNLMLARPYLSRIPAPEMLPGLPEIPPFDNNIHFDPLRAAHPVATRDVDGTYALIYFPLAEQTLQVDLSLLKGQVKAQWFDPRLGRWHEAGYHPNETVAFTSPIAGPDWVLVLDQLK